VDNVAVVDVGEGVGVVVSDIVVIGEVAVDDVEGDENVVVTVVDNITVPGVDEDVDVVVSDAVVIENVAVDDVEEDVNVVVP
ncbi:unnamed protein product, partial [Rotaria sp. Silwood2]